jgi:hypothetical protein
MLDGTLTSCKWSTRETGDKTCITCGLTWAPGNGTSVSAFDQKSRGDEGEDGESHSVGSLADDRDDIA